MKTTIIALSLAIFSLTAVQAQLKKSDIVGAWSAMIQDDQGNSFEATLTFNDDNTYHGEWSGDDIPEVKGTFTIEGENVTITDNGGEMACVGVPGVYKMTIADNNVTMALVSDECPGRKQGAPYNFSRK